jgi:hypothetical protein
LWETIEAERVIKRPKGLGGCRPIVPNGREARHRTAYTPRVFTEYILPERSALLDRKNVRKMNANLQAEAQLTAMVENLTYIS